MMSLHRRSKTPSRIPDSIGGRCPSSTRTCWAHTQVGGFLVPAIPEQERIVVIEDTAELQIRKPNVLAVESYYVKNCLAQVDAKSRNIHN